MRLKWVPFTKASQAVPGAKMRPHQYLKRPGRPRERTVKGRGIEPYKGITIKFEGGDELSLADAKALKWEVKIPDPE